ncbi:DMT family transporter [Aspergillus homomorphus CBS 101889]|uniref:EamA domain-containing protein n=1 Tax=Aspergillus homomorphus (strain CBS 101889) TaxID=1450537 RepID=A0A395HN15_ASPHC|nr:hypothetical protein BO97DRAFT_407837 [Aspergillus homomorphus CBS 101889]RAL09321.1 hypothetical protein BO97DRAFT_407837 [Aspergillus homomorphus CBS 101889]
MATCVSPRSHEDPSHRETIRGTPTEQSPLLSRSSPATMPDDLTSTSSDHQTAWWSSLQELWVQGKGMILVLGAQFFGATMNVMTQVLEIKGNNGKGYHPFQILFARMSITVIVSYLYMWYTKVPHPFGTKPILWLLFLRASGGFFGVYGLYYSVQYLPLSEATVVTFLVPILTGYACSLFIPRETFTRKQLLAGVVSLAGVILIARPFAFLRVGEETDDGEAGDKPGATDSYHHVLAIAVALLGVLGATCAYTTIRMIGRRCHPLVSVTWFSSYTTVVSSLAMLLVPSISFAVPVTLFEWTLLLGLGVCGFLLQFLLTAGLSYVPPARTPKDLPDGCESSAYGTQASGRVEDEEQQQQQLETKPPAQKTSSGSRATFMIYTQMLFALFYDRIVWGSTLSPVSWVGSGLILGCAIYVAVAREERKPESAAAETGSKNDVTAAAPADVENERPEVGGQR